MKSLNFLFYLLVYTVFLGCGNDVIDATQTDISANNSALKSDEQLIAQANCPTKNKSVVSTFAGTGGVSAEDGSRLQAGFNYAKGLAMDKFGNLYITDVLNHKIRKISVDGMVSTVAGNGTIGSADGPGSSASFWQPDGIAIDKNGNIYVGDFNNKIRKISPSGMVSTFAGDGSYGSTDGPANKASFKAIQNLAFDSYGNLYVADAQGHTIRKITPSGMVSTFAGTGQPGGKDGPAKQATFIEPIGIVVDASGNLYVSDGNHKIRKITASGMVSTYAGTGQIGACDGPGYKATFDLPTSMILDASGNLYVSDNYKVRMISPAKVVSTVAGNGIRGTEDGAADKASFDGPDGLALDKAGNIYAGDAFNNKIRMISSKPFKSGLITVNK